MIWIMVSKYLIASRIHSIHRPRNVSQKRSPGSGRFGHVILVKYNIQKYGVIYFVGICASYTFCTSFKKVTMECYTDPSIRFS